MIRSYHPSDAFFLLKIYRPFVENSPVSFELACPSLNEFQIRLEAYAARFPFLVYEEDGIITGYAYASGHRDRPAYQWSCESSIYLAPLARGTGIAMRLYEQLFLLLKARGFCQVLAGITTPNPVSENFHAKCGFEEFARYEKIGFKQGRFHDVLWMRKWLQTTEWVPDSPPLFAPSGH